VAEVARYIHKRVVAVGKSTFLLTKMVVIFSLLEVQGS